MRSCISLEVFTAHHMKTDEQQGPLGRHSICATLALQQMHKGIASTAAYATSVCLIHGEILFDGRTSLKVNIYSHTTYFAGYSVVTGLHYFNFFSVYLTVHLTTG